MESWEQIQLLFNNFTEFLTTVVLPIWQQSWLTAQNIFQTFREFLTNTVNLIKTLFTEFFQKFVNNTVKINWKNAWENAKRIFETFKSKVSEIVNAIRDLLQAFFDWVYPDEVLRVIYPHMQFVGRPEPPAQLFTEEEVLSTHMSRELVP